MKPRRGTYLQRLAFVGKVMCGCPVRSCCGATTGTWRFERTDFERLANQLASIQGRFVPSINDARGAREVFGRFAMEAVPVTYTIATATIGAGTRAGELIVRGGQGWLSRDRPDEPSIGPMPFPPAPLPIQERRERGRAEKRAQSAARATTESPITTNMKGS